MISIDRDSSLAVHEQLAEQLRYLIASGRYQVDETLPSTRALGKQVGVSFHTVRKAYQQLEKEGLLESKVGSGFTVVERAPLTKSERIERGAAVVEEALHRLIALGLTDAEVEYLFQEQFTTLTGKLSTQKVVFAARALEFAEWYAEQLTQVLQQTITAASVAQLEIHPDADVILAPYPDVPSVREIVPRADVFGVADYLTPEALEAVSRLMPHQTLGIVTRYVDAIQPLTSRIKTDTGFTGQMLAASAEAGGGKDLAAFVDQTDLLLFTPAVRRRLLPHLSRERKYAQIAPVISKESVARLREALPS